jgi:hypothetical protein
MKLLTYSSTKIEHSNAYGAGHLTAIMYLAPAQVSGKNVCAWYTPGCSTACLNTAGRGRFTAVQNARIARTRLFYEDRDAFGAQLNSEIAAHVRKAQRASLRPAVRLNGTSDLLWERIFPDIFDTFDIQYYDYTKYPLRFRDKRPANYHLTFSRAETQENHIEAFKWLLTGGNVAVVFDTPKGQPLPERFLSFPIIDADQHDMRFLDQPGTVAGLRAKGDARKDTTGFVVRVA